MNLTSRLLDDALRPVGLSADEFGMYSLIYSFGPMTQTRIARTTGLPLTTVAGALRRITGRGHLHETPNPDDARSRLVELTETGIEATFAGAQVLAALLPRLTATLPTGEPPVRTALDLLDRGLRGLVGADPRPYGLATERDAAPSVGYEGAPLTASQHAEVRRYVDWVRARDQ